MRCGNDGGLNTSVPAPTVEVYDTDHDNKRRNYRNTDFELRQRHARRNEKRTIS